MHSRPCPTIVLVALLAGCAATGSERRPPEGESDDQPEAPPSRRDAGGSPKLPPVEADAASQDAAGAPQVTDAAGPAEASSVPRPPAGTWLDDPNDHATKTLGEANVVKAGWGQKDMMPNANWDRGMTGCPDPDAMVVPGTSQYKDGVWTLTGSGEGFMHGWDQGNLVYFEKRVRGDFDFTAQATELAPVTSFSLNGAAEAVLNVRDSLEPKAPSNSIIAGRMKGRTIFMGRFHWKNESPPNGVGTRRIEDKVWYWPAWPVTWPKEPSMPWMRISRRGMEIRAYVSDDGAAWQEVKNADTAATWYPYRLKGLAGEVILGLVCTARNDRNGAPKKSDGCRDENSEVLRRSARCVFKNVTIVAR